MDYYCRRNWSPEYWTWPSVLLRNGGIPLTRICCGERTQRMLWILRESGKRKRFERWPPAVSTLVYSCRKHLCNWALQAANLSHSLHPCQQLREWAVFDDMNKQLTPLSNRKNWRMWPQSTVQKTKKEKVVSEVWISRVLLVKYHS